MWQSNKPYISIKQTNSTIEKIYEIKTEISNLARTENKAQQI